MRTLSGKELVKLLEARGWRLQQINGSHHIYTKPQSNVRLSVPVHGNKALKLGLLRHLLKAAGIDPREL